MSNKYSRVLAMAVALSLLGAGAAVATQAQHTATHQKVLVPAHGPQPHSNRLSSGHGLATTQKHVFLRTHKQSHKKTGLHGFANGKPNGKGPH